MADRYQAPLYAADQAGAEVLAQAAAKSCCFTGHREILAADLPTLGRRVSDEVRRMASMGVINFIAGGARGFDTLAAEAVLALRASELPQIKLLLAIPCPDQTRGWRAEDVLRYERVFGACDRAVLISQSYTRGCMHTRNRFMVDRSAFVIAYLNETAGGTAYTVDYARRKGRKIVNLGAL